MDVPSNPVEIEGTTTKKRKRYIKTVIEIVAILFWTIAGILFIVSGSIHKDLITIIASCAWTLGCVVWLFTYILG